jgi:uncharacterized repeat protein (TIGR03803 family)
LSWRWERRRLAPAAFASTFKTLYTFTGGADGSDPVAGLVLGAEGLLYGTTHINGADGVGTVFVFNPATKRLTTLHAFTGGTDGANPAAGVVFKAGVLYGTTYVGANGFGTAFKLVAAAKTLTTLHAFSGGADGGYPAAVLAFGTTGALYGTTHGTVFELVPSPPPKLTTLHSFSLTDGEPPAAGVVRDSAGALYGTTSLFGPKGYGTVFKLDPAAKPPRLSTLHAFTNGVDGGEPDAVLTKESGAFYSTTYQGGGIGYGTVFKLDLATKKWTTLYSFKGGFDGATPVGGVVFDRTGVLYGTTSEGGASGCTNNHGCGTVFKLDPVTKRLTTLHVFTGGTDGGNPVAGLILGANGALYGTTSQVMTNLGVNWGCRSRRRC